MTEVPIGPKGPNPNATSGTASGTGTSGSGSSGGGGGATGYERRQNAKEAEAKRKASAKYTKQAQILNQQAQAIKKALRTEFKQALNTGLANVGLKLRQQDKLMMEGYKDRVGSLEGSAEDNVKAEGMASYSNLANRSRERGNALSEVAAQGAGESDQLVAQQMSLRNWSNNQQEVNRGFFDTVRSINTSLTDLNQDTKTARANLFTEADADREMLWNSYYGQQSEAYTQLGNIRGQQAELYGLANEAVGSRKTRRRQNKMEKAMGWAFDQSAEATGDKYKSPGIPGRLMNWQGHDDFEAEQNMSKYVNAQTTIAAPKPEGATLRAWT